MQTQYEPLHSSLFTSYKMRDNSLCGQRIQRAKRICWNVTFPFIYLAGGVGRVVSVFILSIKLEAANHEGGEEVSESASYIVGEVGCRSSCCEKDSNPMGIRVVLRCLLLFRLSF